MAADRWCTRTTATGARCRAYSHVSLDGTCWAHASDEERARVRPGTRVRRGDAARAQRARRDVLLRLLQDLET